jgi:hypothetical protein
LWKLIPPVYLKLCALWPTSPLSPFFPPPASVNYHVILFLWVPSFIIIIITLAVLGLDHVPSPGRATLGSTRQWADEVTCCEHTGFSRGICTAMLSGALPTPAKAETIHTHQQKNGQTKRGVDIPRTIFSLKTEGNSDTSYPWPVLEDIMVRERRQTHNDKHHLISVTWGTESIGTHRQRSGVC